MLIVKVYKITEVQGKLVSFRIYWGQESGYWQTLSPLICRLKYIKGNKAMTTLSFSLLKFSRD